MHVFFLRIISFLHSCIHLDRRYARCKVTLWTPSLRTFTPVYPRWIWSRGSKTFSNSTARGRSPVEPTLTLVICCIFQPRCTFVEGRCADAQGLVDKITREHASPPQIYIMHYNQFCNRSVHSTNVSHGRGRFILSIYYISCTTTSSAIGLFTARMSHADADASF